MAILILEEDARTRETLSRLVKELSFEAIEHVRETVAEELSAYPSHLRLLLCDHSPKDQKARDLLPELAKHPHLNSLPVVWLVARGPRWLQSWWWQRRYPRVDDVLSKPFDREELAAAMSRAYRRRALHCDTILYLGDESPLFTELQASVEEGGPFAAISRFSDCDSLAEAIRPLDGKLGAILIDPAVYARFGKRGLHLARDGVVAQRAVTVCLGRDPVASAPLGPFCDRFVEPPRTRAEWRQLLKTLHRQLREGWRTRLLLQSFKAAQKAKDERAQRRLAGRLARAAGSYSETHTLLGAYHEKRGAKNRAIRHLSEALALNPFFPRTYLLLLKLYVDKGALTDARELAERAAAYCPHHQETQNKVAELRGGKK